MKCLSTLRRRQVSLAAVSMLLSFAPSATHAASQKLYDNNSSVIINPTSDQAVTSWLVNGVGYMPLQSFYYRVGSVGGESAISTIPLVNQTLLSANSLSVTYANALFSLEATYSLVGGAPGSGEASLSEQIKVTNLSGSNLDFHFFQYADFDLAGTFTGDTVQLGKNLQGLYNEAFQYDGDTIADTVVTPGANFGQVSAFPVLLNELTDNLPTTLNGASGPLTGDVAWAFQWDRVLAAGGSFIIGIDHAIYAAPVPEPTTFAILGLSTLLFAINRRKRS